ncbi:TolC family protein [Enterobacter chuandaensis]|uniref:TolC family protein n=1 Tax=Enterobacter chuandaensis TaxID=2497875 RepID=UPI00300D518C
MKVIAVLTTIISLLCTGCSSFLISEFQSPYPYTFIQSSTETVSPKSSLNWTLFDDSNLNYWLKIVLNRNNDLSIAELVLKRTKLQEERVRGNFFPDINTSIQNSHSKLMSTSSDWTESTGASFGGSYAIDLWGGSSAQREAAGWLSKASLEDLNTIKQKLLLNAAINYWHLGLINAEIKTSESTLVYASRALMLARSRYRAGKISGQDVINAQESISNIEIQLLSLKNEHQQLISDRNILAHLPTDAVLFEPKSISLVQMPLLKNENLVYSLRNRSDIKAKENLLRKALLDSDITRFNYYPVFNITGSLGTSSDRILRFLENPVSSVSSSLAFPFIAWNQMEIDTKIAHNSYEQQVLEFKQYLLNAMNEINNAISLNLEIFQEEKFTRTQIEMARELEHINEIRYHLGATDIKPWLDAQQQLRQAELSLLVLNYKKRVNLADLYLKLGYKIPVKR